MAKVRAQVVLQGGTNLAEDRFINTFHFDRPGVALSVAAAAITPALQALYQGAVGGAAIGTFISKFVQRAYTIRYYDLDEPEGSRVPYVSTGTLPSSAIAVAFPEEVAVCLSFHGSLPINPSKRGRVFLGPLNVAATDDATTTAQSVVSPALRTSLAAKATALIDANVGWCIYSQKNDVLVPVEGGFIDNAFDTQRRRGGPSTGRTLFT